MLATYRPPSRIPFHQRPKRPLLRYRHASTNVLVNPYFMTDTNEDGISDNWQVTYSDADIQAATTVSRIIAAIDAGFAQRIQFNNPSLGATRSLRFEILTVDRPKVEPSEVWALTFSFVTTTLANCQLRWLMEWRNSGGTVIQTDQFETTSVYSSWQSGLKRQGMFGIAPDGAVTLHIAMEVFNIQTSGAICDISWASPQLGVLFGGNIITGNISVESNPDGWLVVPYTADPATNTAAASTQLDTTVTVNALQGQRMLLAGVTINSRTVTITGVTLDPGGVNKSLTLVASKVHSTAGLTHALYKLMESDIAAVGNGSKTLRVDVSASVDIAVGARMASRVNQTTPFLDILTAESASAGTTAEITTHTETELTHRYWLDVGVPANVNPDNIFRIPLGSAGPANQWEAFNTGVSALSVAGMVADNARGSISWSGNQDWCAIGAYLQGRAAIRSASGNGYPNGGGNFSIEEEWVGGFSGTDMKLLVRNSDDSMPRATPGKTYGGGFAIYVVSTVVNVGPHMQINGGTPTYAGTTHGFVDPTSPPSSWNTIFMTTPSGMSATWDRLFLVREFAGLTNSVIRHDMAVLGEFMARPTGPKVIGGALAAAGVVVKTPQKPVSGALAAAGTILKEARKAAIEGGLAAAGTLVKGIGKALEGAVSVVGGVAATKVALLTITGAVSAAGELARLSQTVLSGTVTASGTLTKISGKAIVSAVSAAGSVTAIKVALLAVTGAVSVTATLGRQPQKALSGAISAVGIVIRQPVKIITGAITASGILIAEKLANTFFQTVNGAVAAAGTLARQPQKLAAGAVGASGTLSRLIARLLTGGMAVGGSVASLRVVVLLVIGAMSAVGTLGKRAAKGIAGAVAPAGTLIKKPLVSIAGAMGSAGAVAAQFISGTVVPFITISGRSKRDTALGGSSRRDGVLTGSSRRDREF